MPLVNHAFARMNFLRFRGGLSSKAPGLLVRTQTRHFCRFRQNPLFLAGGKGTLYQKHRFFFDPDQEKEEEFVKQICMYVPFTPKFLQINSLPVFFL